MVVTTFTCSAGPPEDKMGWRKDEGATVSATVIGTEGLAAAGSLGPLVTNSLMGHFVPNASLLSIKYFLAKNRKYVKSVKCEMLELFPIVAIGVSGFDEPETVYLILFTFS